VFESIERALRSRTGAAAAARRPATRASYCSRSKRRLPWPCVRLLAARLAWPFWFRWFACSSSLRIRSSGRRPRLRVHCLSRKRVPARAAPTGRRASQGAQFGPAHRNGAMPEQGFLRQPLNHEAPPVSQGATDVVGERRGRHVAGGAPTLARHAVASANSVTSAKHDVVGKVIIVRHGPCVRKASAYNAAHLGNPRGFMSL
jgi:hypothetical protein